MLARTPLKRKRDEPRRNEGRIKHKRMARKASAPPTAAEKRHMGRIAAMGCLVCGMPAEVHHVTSDGFKRLAKLDRYVAPLCPRHHRIGVGGRESVEWLNHARFTETYGIDLLAWAVREWERSNG